MCPTSYLHHPPHERVRRLVVAVALLCICAYVHKHSHAIMLYNSVSHNTYSNSYQSTSLFDF